MNRRAFLGTTAAALAVAGKALAGQQQAPAPPQPRKGRLKQGVTRGVFGLPSFFVNGELFFGKDRLRDVEEALERVGS